MNSTIQINLSVEELKTLIHESVRCAMSGIGTPPDPEIMDIDGAAKFLNVKRSTIYNYTHRQLIPYLKQSGKLHFKRSDLMAWLNAGQHLTLDEIIQSA